MTFQVVNGLSFDQWIELPDGSRIVSADWGVQPDWSQQTQRAFRNHNIFRLDKDGNVMWQIRRDEGELEMWARSREKAEAENSDDVWTRSPFTVLYLSFSDGSTNVNRETHQFPREDKWVEGATVRCATLDSRDYELDPESGLAKNIYAPGRPW